MDHVTRGAFKGGAHEVRIRPALLSTIMSPPLPPPPDSDTSVPTVATLPPPFKLKRKYDDVVGALGGRKTQSTRCQGVRQAIHRHPRPCRRLQAAISRHPREAGPVEQARQSYANRRHECAYCRHWVPGSLRQLSASRSVEDSPGSNDPQERK
ncbi:hypothetical protein B0H11DRAFT_178231 [Mycena galericulata]|nr:hypothetical protein B0H11DRAFT_178231 [Mycena galericulata]